MAGLKNVLDLGLGTMLSSSTPVPVVAPEPIAPVVESVLPSSPVVVPVVPALSVPKVKKSKSKLSPSWKQTGLSLTADTMLRLKLESLKSGKTMSELAETILGRNLPHNRIAV